MRLRAIIVGLSLALGFGALGSSPATALTFTFTTIPGDTLTQAQSDAFATAAQAWSNVFADPITVTATIGFTSLGGNVLGQTTPSIDSAPYTGVQAALGTDARSSADQQAVAALPSMVPNGTILLSNAQVKALGGVAPQSSDGKIEFNSSYNFATARNPDGTISSNSYDLIGIAEHEIGHLLGFDSAIDFGNPDKTILDLFRYSAAEVASFQAGASAYFSLDNGVTQIAPFADGSANQASHWANNYLYNGVPALMDPEGALGEVINITPLDTLALDVLGYDPVADTAVPEPAALPLFLAALMAGAALMTRRQRPS